MFLSVVLYLSSNSVQPTLTVDGLLQELQSSNFLFSLTIVSAGNHQLSKELNLGHEGIIFTVEDTLSISEGLNEGLKFVNQSKIQTDYVCLFYDDFQLSKGYFNSILVNNVEDIDKVILFPSYITNRYKEYFFSLNGVVFRYQFLQLMLGRLYDEYVSWEDYPYYYAIARRYKIVKSEACFTTLNHRFKKQFEWIKEGIGYKEKRHTLLFVLRFAIQLFSHLQFTAGIFLVVGYLKGSNFKYPSKIIRKITVSKMKELNNLLVN